MAKMYETKKIIVARFSVINMGYEVNKIHRGMKSNIILSTTRETIPKKYINIIRIQTESFREGIKVIQRL